MNNPETNVCFSRLIHSLILWKEQEESHLTKFWAEKLKCLGRDGLNKILSLCRVHVLLVFAELSPESPLPMPSVWAAAPLLDKIRHGIRVPCATTHADLSEIPKTTKVAHVQINCVRWVKRTLYRRP